MRAHHTWIGLSALWLLASSLAAAPVSSIRELKSDELAGRIRSDLQAVSIWRGGLEAVVQFATNRPDLFPAESPTGLRMLTRETKEEIWSTWKRFLDYSVALNSTREFYAAYALLPDRGEREDAFAVFHGAFLAEYRFALEFIRLAEKDPGIAVLLDDPVPELGLPKGTYGRFKFTFLNPARATEFAALGAVAALMPARGDATGAAIAADKAALWAMGRKEGQILTVENAADIVRAMGAGAWYPVQKGAAIWMGDTKVWRPGVSLIVPAQIEELSPRLEPGDILLERREWYLSNVGLPGFWPHAAIYIGTADQRRAFFADPEVQDWARAQGLADGNVESLLAARYPDAYRLALAAQTDGHVPRVLEAIGEGVSLTTLEHSAAADSLAVLRPRLSRKEKAVAILRAFHYVGRPYDYNFDFATDSAVVCTELVWKSFQPCPDSRGIAFPTVTILGRLATPANELVKQFDETYGTEAQIFDLVAFLDGQEKSRTAAAGTLEEFRASWQRPKWHVIRPEAELTAAPARPAKWAQPIQRPGLPNLHKVSDALYRGAQPTAEGVRELAALGVKSVVSLRSFHSDEDLLKGSPLAYVPIEAHAWNWEEDDVQRFLAVVTDTNRTPVFVHCQHGADRTGTMCAIYRMVVQGWTPKDAAREMQDGGYGFHPIWRNLANYVEDFDVDATRRKAGLSR